MMRQNSRRETGSTPVVGSSSSKQVGLVHERDRERELLLHAAREMLGQAILERREPRERAARFRHARTRSPRGTPRRSAKKSTFSRTVRSP